MVTPEMVNALIERITYKPFWTLTMFAHKDHFDLQWTFIAKDPGNISTERIQYGRRWSLPWHCCYSEVLHTALLAVITAEEHECREHFKLDHKAIFGPHHRIEALLALADNVESRLPVELYPLPLKGTIFDETDKRTDSLV